MSTIKVDKLNSLWIGTRRNGAYIFNETGDRKRAHRWISLLLGAL